MSNEENDVKSEIIIEQEQNEELGKNNSNDNSFTENLIQELKTKNIYIITKNYESIIQQILEYLHNNSNPVGKKLEIIKYLEDLFTKVNFNSEIFLQKSKKLNLNIYQVIINQCISNNKENKEYLNELKELFLLLLSQITFDREIYHYLLSFIINYINKCNNNIDDNNNFNAEQLSIILLLLQLYYQSVQSVDEPYNYYYFNGDSDTFINLDLKNNSTFNKKYYNCNEINFLLFIKLIPNNIVQNIYPEISSKIIDIYLKSNEDKETKKHKNIIISIDKDYFLCTNYTSKNLVKLPENKLISILVKINIKEITKTEIFIDNEKIEISKDIIIPDFDKKSNKGQKIKNVKLFQNFVGICSNIIIYKENEKEKNIGLPKFFLSSLSSKGKKCLKQVFIKGIYTENLFNVLLKPDFKDKVDNKSYKQILFPTKEKLDDNDIKAFVENDLISIYIPNRFMSIEKENKKKILMKDSINGIDGVLDTQTPGLNGVHIFKRFSEDFEPFGGLNHFLPILEIMSLNYTLLENENLFNFFCLISSIFMPSYKNALKTENNSNFFFNLSYFLEKIPDKYFDQQLCSKLISISTSIIYYQGDYVNIIRQFHNDILMNKAIFFKFKREEQSLILMQINSLFDMIKNEGFIFDIMLLINIILTYDEERYYKFCCKFHSEYFNTQNEIYNPELKEVLKPVEDIISKLFEIFIREAGKSQGKECKSGKMLFKLFELLTLDISPCLQKMIIKFFLNYMRNHMGKYFSQLDTNRRMFDITLFLFKTTIFDIKLDAFNLILLMNKVLKQKDESIINNDRTNSWAFTVEDIEVIDTEKSILIENYILPIYLLSEDILVSNKVNNEEDNSTKMNNSDEIKVENKKNKEKKDKKLKKNNFYKINDDGTSKAMTYTNDKQFKQFNNETKINQNVVTYNSIKISPEQKKIYQTYKKEKINLMLSELYNNSLNSFKESENYNFFLNLLIKIVSKSDTNLICKFLNDIQEKSKNKKIRNNIYQSELLFHWLLETSFQSFMIKETNFDKNKFKPGFNIEQIYDNSSGNYKVLSEHEKLLKIEQIYLGTKELILNIINYNIYPRLDYLFSWSKYYYQLRSSKNNFQNVKNFILNLLENVFNSVSTFSFSEKENNNQNEYIYFLSLVFEFLTFYNFNAESKDSYFIRQELYQNFPSILLIELRNQEETSDEKDVKLNKKWIYFYFYQKIFLFFKPLFDLSDKKKNNEKDNIQSLKKYIGKKNIFSNELHLLFRTYDHLEKSDNANKGIKNVFLVFHFFILLFSIVEDKEEIKSYYNDFNIFICLLIISSSTLTNYENKKQKWPNDSEYHDIQDTVELILCYTLNYYKDKIIEIKSSIKKHEEKKDEQKLKYYNIQFQILIEGLGNILKLLGILYNETKSSFFSKLKSGESASKSGPFALIKNIYFLLEPKDINSSEKEENCINNILKLNIKRDSKESNSDLEKNIFLFINNKDIQNYIYEQLREEKNQEKLYPFEKIIRTRHEFIKRMIPIYNNKLNVDETQEDMCLVPDYWQESRYNKTLEKKIGEINNEFITEILLTRKKVNLEMNQKIKEYKIIKKKLFTFKGMWSKEEFFYDSKYNIKYKLLNHYTQDFAKILLTPVVDMDYYLPSFSDFETPTLFRPPENQIPIYYLVDLSFALLNSPKFFYQNKNGNNQQNKEKNSRSRKPSIKSKRTALFDLKQINYSFADVQIKKQLFTDNLLFEEYINIKHLSTQSENNTKVNACLVKPELHISGIFYNNSKEIGFYSSDRIPDDNEEYDISRQVCFGSILKPQTNKYNYYYINISYNEIDFVLKRKYYFKSTGLEIFTINKKSYFFRLKENDLKTVYKSIKNNMKDDIEDISVEYTKFEEKIGFFNKNKSIKKKDFYNETFISITNNTTNMNMKYLYDKWIKWEISTLKLLTFLNFYSNRSFNDINQYPVFPWISLDYELDSFSYQDTRPFETPMGMLTFSKGAEERKESFLSTWKVSCDENEEEEGRFRSHYSTSLYTTYYLVRVFPYASMRIELQGKNFDDPHRLFNSVKSSFWCATTQRADLRELIPEFFYFPEMFYNMNKFNLGQIKDKVTNIAYDVNDTAIPEWANSDGYIFINMHRMYLESPEVNEKINEWFNLIFGVKRRGNLAKKINNLFLEYTYDEEFRENYDKSEDNMKIYYCRMVEFGITPHQIFKNESGKRLGYNELKSKKDTFINMTEILKKKEEKNVEIINELQLSEEETFFPSKIFLNQKGEDEDKKKLFVLDNSNGIIKMLKIEHVQKKLANNNNNISENKISKKILSLNDSKKSVKLISTKNRLNGAEGNTPTVIYNKGQCIALGGFWNGSFLIETILSDNNKKEKGDKIETKIYLTKDNAPITNILVEENETFMLCGNNIGVVYVYIIDSKEKNELHLYKILYDNYSPISSLAFDEKLNIFITCFKDGVCNLYTTPQCKLVNSFLLKNILKNNSSLSASISLISSSPLPCFIFYFRKISSLCICSINGHLIKEQKIDYEIVNNNHIKKFTDNQFIDYLLIMDRDNEAIYIYNIIDLQIVMIAQVNNYTLIDFAISKDFDNLFVLVKNKEKKEKEKKENEYKILIMKNIILKMSQESEKKLSAYLNPEEIKKE